MKKILVCNQKMLLDYKSAKKVSEELKDYKDDLIICPNFLNMDLYEDYNIGAQNCHYEKDGAYTGEVSPYHLSHKGVKYVLLGHSERREFENDATINKKVVAAQENGLIPILCVGETKLERDMRRTAEVIKKQLITDLKNIDKAKPIFVAYEPRWLIGKNRSLGIGEIEDTYLYIKRILDKLDISNYKILYGGSVTDENIGNVLSDKLDGYLIGAASCDVVKLKRIIKRIKM